MYSTVHSITNTSAIVDWSRPSSPNGVILGYHLYFLQGNQTDVRTIRSQDPRMEYILNDLTPSSMYHVWIRAFTNKHEGESSTRLSVRTDVSSPMVSSVTNVTCHIDNSVTMEWTPCTWNKDLPGVRCVYSIKMTNEKSGDDVLINVNDTTIENENDSLNIVTDPLENDSWYSISVRASSVSIYRSEIMYHSDWSPPVHLHIKDDCQLSYSPRLEPEILQITETILSASRPDAGVIAGIVVSCLIMVFVILGIIFWKKFCKESYYYLDESGGSPGANVSTQWETEIQHRVTAEQFLAQVKNLHLEGDKEFVVHYKNVTHTNKPMASSSPTSYEQPFFVDGYKQQKAYIVSPLPLPYKFNFFWKQIWEMRVSVIVMLENIAENGKVRILFSTAHRKDFHQDILRIY